MKKRFLCILTCCFMWLFSMTAFSEEEEDFNNLENYIDTIASWPSFNLVLYQDVLDNTDLYCAEPFTFRGIVDWYDSSDTRMSIICTSLVQNSDSFSFLFVTRNSSYISSISKGDEIQIEALYLYNNTNDWGDGECTYPCAYVSTLSIIDPSISALESSAFDALKTIYKKNLYSVIYDPEKGVLAVEASIDSIRSRSNLESCFEQDLLKAMQAVKPLHSDDTFPFASFSVTLRGGLVDNYGNVSDVESCSAEFSWETIQRINFKGINPESLPKIADTWFIHPAFNK